MGFQLPDRSHLPRYPVIAGDAKLTRGSGQVVGAHLSGQRAGLR
jgi:hypothetical protein